ncbi:MAG: hypothetical protein HY897_15930 [Deltaproteobacteria bacterium]|nr:hypothetical protein [Deltaproteobacteria bacterium]
MKQRMGVLFFAVAVPALAFGFLGCRHLGLADDADAGRETDAGIRCDPCTEYQLRIYECLEDACSGLDCDVCRDYLQNIAGFQKPECDGGGISITPPESCPIGVWEDYIEKIASFDCQEDAPLADTIEEYCGEEGADGSADCPNAGSICESGYLYFDYEKGSCDCFPPGLKPLGEICSAANECIPGAVCAKRDKTMYCLKVCKDTSVCTEGGRCLPYKGGFSVCVPDEWWD